MDISFALVSMLSCTYEFTRSVGLFSFELVNLYFCSWVVGYAVANFGISIDFQLLAPIVNRRIGLKNRFLMLKSVFPLQDRCLFVGFVSALYANSSNLVCQKSYLIKSPLFIIRFYLIGFLSITWPTFYAGTANLFYLCTPFVQH
ncbi:hypothetical protein [Echinococcus multilocularis]|uniref:Uncharacterized protein n=1 Tax=Echinococcus multilocularis TaxID=6211 RepID=A0A068Y6W5_ECHMU|nr:hypothetical protein [Echinococcus multilocularis]